MLEDALYLRSVELRNIPEGEESYVFSLPMVRHLGRLEFQRQVTFLVGENGAGKSTFLKILSGEIDSTGGHVYVDPKARMSVLKQNQGMYDAYTVLDTVIMGNMRLYECGKEKDAIYEKADFTDEDGNDRMKETVQANYRRIKEEVKQIVQEELERIKNDPVLCKLLPDNETV